MTGVGDLRRSLYVLETALRRVISRLTERERRHCLLGELKFALETRRNVAGSYPEKEPMASPIVARVVAGAVVVLLLAATDRRPVAARYRTVRNVPYRKSSNKPAGGLFFQLLESVDNFEFFYAES